MKRERKPSQRLIDEVTSTVVTAAPKCGEVIYSTTDTRDDTTAPKKKNKRAQRRPRDPMQPLGYALRLSEYHNYGECGIPERVSCHSQYLKTNLLYI